MTSARPRSSRDIVYRASVAIADALAGCAALVMSIALVRSHHLSIVSLATVPLIVVLSNIMGTYDREGVLVRKSTLDEAPLLFQLATLYALAVWLIDGLAFSGERSRRELLVLWTSLFLFLSVFRAVARRLSRRLAPPEHCLVIGDDATCDWIQSVFSRRASLHAKVIASIRPESFYTQDSVAGSLTADMQDLFLRLGADRIIVAPQSAADREVIGVVHAATSLGLKVSVLPPEVVGSSGEFDDIEGAPLLSIRPFGLSRSSRFLKRFVDLIGSSLGLLLLSPLLLCIAALIKLDSRGPVLFRQSRIGRAGTEFKIFKFRTMVCDAEEQKYSLLPLSDPDRLFKLAEDPRITRIGKVLRRTSLDELPQLMNVVLGEMSLVGPRPLIPEEDGLIEGWRRRRLKLTPGMTGHWQVLGSARIPLAEMVRIDYLYVTNWSLWLDVKILLRTIPYVIAGKSM
jgi:exopolysaccharide biosynthesis polyprenyl glycosylphosphotransferase